MYSKLSYWLFDRKEAEMPGSNDGVFAGVTENGAFDEAHRLLVVSDKWHACKDFQESINDSLTAGNCSRILERLSEKQITVNEAIRLLRSEIETIRRRNQAGRP